MMTMRIKQTTRLGLLLLGTLTLTGCWFLAAGVVAGTAVYSYKVNRLESLVERPVATVHQATLDGLKDLELRVTRESVDKLSGRVEAVNAQGKTIVIDENRQTENTTKLTIRVATGLMSEDKTQAEAIYNAVDKHLK